MPQADAATTSEPANASASSTTPKKAASAPEKKYKCQYCNRAFSRSEHRSRHERSHTKERPFKCQKCRSTFVRRDLLLRHDRTVHAKDGGVPLQSEGRKKSGTSAATKATPSTAAPSKPSISIDPGTLEQIEASSDGMLDLETAAMLMTDFQHKAAAAAAVNGHLHNGDGSIPDYSPDRSSLLESSDYLTGPNVLPHMPWDSFMPQGPSEPKAHSMSSISSQDNLSQPPFVHMGSIQPHQSQLPPIMERQNSLGSSLPPTFPSLADTFPVSGTPTPNALSPFPSMTGPVSPVNYRKSPGPAQPLSLPKAPQLNNDDERAIIANQLGGDIALPSLPSINLYLTTYFNLFHHHLPFLHPVTFHPESCQPALLLAIFSIGALYNFEQEQAYMLHHGSKKLVNQFLQNKDNFDSRKCPLWTMQSTLLNMVFESWSGGSQGLEWACSIKSLLANMVAGNKYELKLRIDARAGAPPTHEQWVTEEGCRRTYYAVYIFFGMLTLTYNHTPAISFNEFDSLPLPSSESLWIIEPTDEDSWQDIFAASPTITVREAYDSLFQGDAARYSAFATRVMINALFLEVWNLRRSFESLQDVVLEWKIRIALETWERSLDLCEPEIIVVPLSTPHKSHPLIFNSMAVYRNTRAFLEVDLKNVQEALRYHNSYEIAAAMTLARDNVKRTKEMIKVIEQGYECMEIVAMQGINWVTKTSSTNWSIEHPLCGLDLITILSLWLYRIEHDDQEATDEELAMYMKVRGLFDDDAVDANGSRLSSTVARVWGTMLDGVVVWGISKTMGESFKLHSQALIGYVDELSLDPVTGMQVSDHALMGMETAY
ncbi:hypothetical protein LTR67_000651 [Exophiala xenobiotica]|nr:hypothetical protein H2202_008937 [Exophiala xenobiotica]KAK5200087.1 hypothetical protein LTR92_000628 [Exophiala xenobiotica]KAK5213999.1 hypothetical protein LTR41_000191 [Exophiala xenobiotica]KAK5228967.1 hypothetical protein LTR47_008125 [Exophiala xenobiotica]KAK5246327.1 hypothetical protein LTS06_008349 [Exophiala xenobiotica]